MCVPLSKRLPIRSLCKLWFIKCNNMDGVSTNSARAHPLKKQ